MASVGDEGGYGQVGDEGGYGQNGDGGGMEAVDFCVDWAVFVPRCLGGRVVRYSMVWQESCRS